ncbi:MAG: transposase, partial [Gammaproteobacteria bacterium CG12_big_fil_rev_8_21_14_0_65_46_12]
QSLDKVAVDTYSGRVHVNWDHNTPVTPFGQLAFFIEFLKRTELFDHFVEQCPLKLTSPNAPSNRDILGTILFSVLAGHTRYAHMATVRTDKVNPPLLGMRKIVSDDSVRRGLNKISKDAGRDWLMEALKNSYSEILTIPWILDVDTTVKCLYGHQEGAVVGYNPKKPGRPSHTYHSYMIANIRMILDVEVMPGNESSASHTLPSLFAWLDSIPIEKRPQFIRGDCNFGTDAVMRACEERHQSYLFKLKQTPNIKRLISQQMVEGEWVNAGQGWQGVEGAIQLMGWEKERRVIILRRKIKKEIGVINKKLPHGQAEFNFAEMGDKFEAFEYAVLVTTLQGGVMTIAQHYRDRADSENDFDELKNQWGWAGYTTHDMHRCQLMARLIALIYNWWTLFVRLIEPNYHLEAITSRPLLLHAVGTQTQHAGQKVIQVNSNHADFKKVQSALANLSAFFKTLKSSAEQLSKTEKMRRVIRRAFRKFIETVKTHPPNLLPAPG